MRAPTENVSRELERYLGEENTRVGQVFRLTRRGLNPDQIAGELGVRTPGFVSNARTKARALLEGVLPDKPSMARDVLGFVRRSRATEGFSDQAVEYLEALEAALRKI